MKGTTSSGFVRSPDIAAARCTCAFQQQDIDLQWLPSPSYLLQAFYMQIL
jgi:hypothetical protein